MVKYLNTTWKSLTRYIHKQISSGTPVDYPLLGRFFTSYDCITFVPHLDFINSGRFNFITDQNNISPLSKQVPK